MFQYIKKVRLINRIKKDCKMINIDMRSYLYLINGMKNEAKNIDNRYNVFTDEICLNMSKVMNQYIDIYNRLDINLLSKEYEYVKTIEKDICKLSNTLYYNIIICQADYYEIVYPHKYILYDVNI